MRGDVQRICQDCIRESRRRNSNQQHQYLQLQLPLPHTNRRRRGQSTGAPRLRRSREEVIENPNNNNNNNNSSNRADDGNERTSVTGGGGGGRKASLPSPLLLSSSWNQMGEGWTRFKEQWMSGASMINMGHNNSTRGKDAQASSLQQQEVHDNHPLYNPTTLTTTTTEGQVMMFPAPVAFQTPTPATKPSTTASAGLLSSHVKRPLSQELDELIAEIRPPHDHHDLQGATTALKSQREMQKIDENDTSECHQQPILSVNKSPQDRDDLKIEVLPLPRSLPQTEPTIEGINSMPLSSNLSKLPLPNEAIEGHGYRLSFRATVKKHLKVPPLFSNMHKRHRTQHQQRQLSLPSPQEHCDMNVAQCEDDGTTTTTTTTTDNNNNDLNNSDHSQSESDTCEHDYGHHPGSLVNKHKHNNKNNKNNKNNNKRVQKKKRHYGRQWSLSLLSPGSLLLRATASTAA